jgi:hypothetical protein
MAAKIGKKTGLFPGFPAFLFQPFCSTGPMRR